MDALPDTTDTIFPVSIMSDHDLLIRLDTRMGDIRKDMREMKEGTSIKVQDHELRIRRLEQWVWLAVGGGFVLQGILYILLK